MTINSPKLFQFFKYVVYTLLAFNVFVFWREEFLAAVLQFPNGVEISHIIASFPATIDTAAWLVLLLMFELETYVLEDHDYSPRVTWSLQGVRVFCYGFIVYAFYGYVAKLGFIYDATPLANVSDLCALVTDGWSYAVDLDEYVELTAANCAALSDAGAFFRFDAMPAVVDLSGLNDIRHLAWVDVINAGVWLLVVLVLEVDVRLQEKNRYEGLALRLSYATKYVLYSLLLLAAIYWGIKGDFVDFWDAFLWLVAFVFIELNVFEWRQEVKDEQQKAAAGLTS
ncbi:MAG TPA: hypothetical protein PKH39_13575 [Woeseiaceae bacterium]|nr:hypothetical protein [Woeseiaceae bacterium]